MVIWFKFLNSNPVRGMVLKSSIYTFKAMLGDHEI